MDRSHRPKMLPVTAIVMFLTLALSTLVSEDLACIAAGLLVSDGRAGFLLVTLACFVGIFLGDILLFLAGKFIGRRALKLAAVRWVISPERLESSSKWLERNGATVIFTSRFIPGTRLPTYLAAGMLHKNSLRFVFYFLASCAVWTPLLVGAAAGLFTPLMRFGPMADKSFGLKLIVAAVLFLVILRLIIKGATFRGRRELTGWFYRKIRWEFWPPWVFYPPVFLYILYLGLKFKGLTVFTASNPGIVAGGFVGESKYEILSNLGAGDWILRFKLIPAGETEERIQAAHDFMTLNGYSWPVVLKPDAGQRGSGVAVIRSEEQLREYLTRTRYDAIIQEYAGGSEFGVFYYRHPGETKGRIFSITEKRLPVLTGDGRQTLQHLILNDDRAVCMAAFYSRKNAAQLERVPARGEAIQLVELGTHCRGAIFLDGSHAITPELTEAIDRISQTFRGFYFGRYDLRTPSVEELKAGLNCKVIELNGVSSEATHIYDPKLSLWEAYRVLFQQWKIAYEIGSENRARGTKPASVSELVRFMAAYRELSRGHGT
jgi:membrane protein DedA with SNARE-associated domain